MSSGITALVRDDCQRVARERYETLSALSETCLVVTGGTGFVGTWLAELIAYLNDAHRFNTRLVLVSGRASNFGAKAPHLAAREDITLIERDVRGVLELPEDITYEPVVTYHPTLITPPDHPLASKKAVTLKEISPFGLILPPRHLSTWRMVDLVFSQHHVPYHVALEAGGWEIIKKYVELGMGISIVTDVCLTGGEKLAAIPLEKYFPKRSYGIVLRKNKFLSPQAQRFIDMMHEHFKIEEQSMEEDPAS